MEAWRMGEIARRPEATTLALTDDGLLMEVLHSIQGSVERALRSLVYDVCKRRLCWSLGWRLRSVLLSSGRY